MNRPCMDDGEGWDEHSSGAQRVSVTSTQWSARRASRSVVFFWGPQALIGLVSVPLQQT